jgi:hypothetical protein
MMSLVEEERTLSAQGQEGPLIADITSHKGFSQ